MEASWFATRWSLVASILPLALALRSEPTPYVVPPVVEQVRVVRELDRKVRELDAARLRVQALEQKVREIQQRRRQCE
jgi:hypothetical protein